MFRTVYELHIRWPSGISDRWLFAWKTNAIAHYKRLTDGQSRKPAYEIVDMEIVDGNITEMLEKSP